VERVLKDGGYLNLVATWMEAWWGVGYGDSYGGSGGRSEALSDRSWSSLPATTRRLIVVGGAVELGFKVAALRDIYRRADEEIRGNKWEWVAAQAINTFGPLSYFMFGRKKK
jgi:hypothetical protein